MKKSIFLLTILFLVGLLLFTSCKKDDENETDYNRLENITYPIDENSSFNMTNFISSYEQIFKLLFYPISSISNDIEAGKAIYSYQNYDGYGEFGKKISTFTHIFNEDGIITSSIRQGADERLQYYNMTIDYDYDLNGFITKLIQKRTVVYATGRNVLFIDTLKYEYNENNKIAKEISIHNQISYDIEDDHSILKNNIRNSISIHNPFDIEHNKQIGETISIYEYNQNNQVSSIESTDRRREFIYSESDIVFIREYSSGTLDFTIQYNYDNNKRYRSIEEFFVKFDDLYRVQFTYNSNSVKSKHYSNNELQVENTYTNHLHLNNRIRYLNYGSEYTHAISIDYDSECRPATKHYLERDDNLEYNIVAYNTIDSRAPDFKYHKSHESAYDNNDNLLFYVEYGLENNPFGGSMWGSNYFLPNGDQVDIYDLSEFNYSRELLYTDNYHQSYYYVAGDISE